MHIKTVLSLISETNQDPLEFDTQDPQARRRFTDPLALKLWSTTNVNLCHNTFISSVFSKFAIKFGKYWLLLLNPDLLNETDNNRGRKKGLKKL